MVLVAASPVYAQQSRLPATLPGLSRDEGTFLATTTDDGSRVVYFIAQNARHAILDADLVAERQLNALWPVREASVDEVLAYDEGAPVGKARTGVLDAPAVEAATPIADPAPEAEEVAPVGEQQATYVVKPGQSAIGIARELGIDVDQLLAANGVSDRNRIYAGQVLTVPATSS